jgi:hypothetical protein
MKQGYPERTRRARRERLAAENSKERSVIKSWARDARILVSLTSSNAGSYSSTRGHVMETDLNDESTSAKLPIHPPLLPNTIEEWKGVARFIVQVYFHNMASSAAV